MSSKRIGSVLAARTSHRPPHVPQFVQINLDGTDVSVTFHDASASQDAVITWDEATGRGSIQVPDYNGGARGCWDEQQQNVDCAPAAVATAIR